MPQEFNLPIRPAVTAKNQARITLQTFGLSALKTALYQKADQQIKDQPVSYSYLGTPIFADVKLYRNSDTSFSNPLVLTTVLCDVSRSKNIVTTMVNGRNGSVKEYYSNQDYTISFKGIIASEFPDVYPQNEVLALAQILDLGESLVVVSDFLNQIFGIHNIAITDQTINQMEGFRNVQPFQFSALSDDPIELSINK